MIRIGATVAAAMLLGACSILPQSEPSEIYRISAAEGGEAAARGFGAPTVMISLPSASRTVGGDNIMVARPDGSMALAAGARWAAPARNMVQDYIIETFEAQAPGLAPLRPGDGLSGDYDLAIDLRNFEAEYDRGMEAAPLVRVGVGARLISSARDLQGSTVTVAEIRASTNRMTEIVAAFDQATADVAAELTGWTIGAVAEAERRAAIEAGEQRPEPNVDVDVGVDVDVEEN